MLSATIIGSRRISADPIDMLAHYALGEMPGYTGAEGSPAAWLCDAHRGVHRLEQIRIPRGQRRYVFSPRFEFRINTAFEEVVRGCADLARTGHTWIVPELLEGYLKLHEMGFAHSFESWQDGQLVGGVFGVQMGACISVESMFRRVSHASKAAYGRALHHVKERGFLLVDSNPVKDSSLNYGEEWIPQWRFQELLRQALSQPAPSVNGHPAPELPWQVRRLLPFVRFFRKIAGKLRRDPD